MSSHRLNHAEGLQPIAPTLPVAGYIGGKRNLSRRLVERIAAIPHQAYAEPFVGMGGVFFRRRSRPSAEFINDWSMDVATFFRILQRHYVAFMDMLRFQLTTRLGFEQLLRTDPTTMTDLERAARFLYLQRTAFGGKVVGRGFGVAPQSPARFDVTKLGPMLEAVHERLAPVTIERLPWADFVRRYDRPGTLFYLDPPYLAASVTMVTTRGSRCSSAPNLRPWQSCSAAFKGAFYSRSTTARKCAQSSPNSPLKRSKRHIRSAAWTRPKRSGRS